MIINGFKIEPGADLRGADLRGADLRGADLRGANLYRANLRGADLYRADLYRADLEGANLREADLSETYLRGTNLGGANLYGANLRGAQLRGADLEFIQGKQICTFSSSRHFTYCCDGYITVGCMTDTIINWLNKYKEAGKKEGYSEEEIEQYGTWIKLMSKIK